MDERLSDVDEPRGIKAEILVVLLVTFGLSGARSALSLLESALQTTPLAQQSVALNASRSSMSLIDLAWQILSFTQLFAWAGLGLYLLWRSGRLPAAIGLGRFSPRHDIPPSLALAALIGIPGLGLYFVAHAAGINLTVVPTSLHDHWWRIPVLIIYAIANAAAEEVLVVGYLLTRLRDLGWSKGKALTGSAVLRGSYHLYQGIGGGVGNLVMGLVFGRYWQSRQRLWPLICAHASIDIIAFVGYAVLHGHFSWL